MDSVITNIMAPIDHYIEFEEKAGRGRGHWGHKGRKGKRGGSLPKGAAPSGSVEKAINRYVHYKNLRDLDREPGMGLHTAEAVDWEGDKYPVSTLMYNPKPKVLLVGNDDHAVLASKYAPMHNYDDFVKMTMSADYKEVRIFLDRTQAGNTTAAWDKAFEAAKILRSCGVPEDFTVKLTYWERDKVVSELGLGEI